jgi:molybdopterin-guanine dinucleotide biosynthesis protein MobB
VPENLIGDDSLIIGVVGESGAGKTSLIESLVRELSARRVRVSSIKHVHDGNVLIPQGKDTTRHLLAGSNPVIGISSNEVVIYINDSYALDNAISLLNKIASPDVIIVEGFKQSSIPKIVIGNIEVNGPVLLRCGSTEECLQHCINLIEREVKRERILQKLPGLNCGKCGFPGCKDLADAVVNGIENISTCKNRGEAKVKILVNEDEVQINKFVSELVSNVISALVKSLKNVNNPGSIRISIDFPEKMKTSD